MSHRVTAADLASIAPILATAVIMLLGNGLLGTLIPVRANIEGFSNTAIALMGSAYFVGFIAGCWVCPRLTLRVGHIRAFAVQGALTAAFVLIHAIIIDPYVWAILRAGIGFCAAGMFALLEGWLNQQAHNKVRGRIFTIYATLNNLALMMGQYFFTLSAPASFELFSLTAILTLFCLLPVGLTTQDEPARSKSVQLNLPRLWGISPVAVAGAFVVGLVSGAFWTLAPIYAEARGMHGNQIAWFMSAVIFGGTIAQWPLGRLSDFTDRRFIIAGAAIAAALAGLILASPAAFSMDPSLWLMLGGALYGATAFPIGSLTNAHLNDHAKREEMTEISSGNLFVYGVAAAIGPAIAAGVIAAWGLNALFIYTALMHAMLVGFVFYRMAKRAPAATADRPSFEVETIQPAPMHVAPDSGAAKD